MLWPLGLLGSRSSPVSRFKDQIPRCLEFVRFVMRRSGDIAQAEMLRDEHVLSSAVHTEYLAVVL